MRRMLWAAVAMLTALYGSDTFAVTITLTPSATEFGFGESFSVDVIAEDAALDDPILAFGFNIVSDAGLSFAGASVGPDFFDDTGFFGADVAGSAFPPVGGGSVLLATLDFTTGLLPGIFGLSVTTDPSELGLSQGLITLLGDLSIDQTTLVSVVAPTTTAVPEPASLLLLLTGLGAVGLRRRREETP